MRCPAQFAFLLLTAVPLFSAGNSASAGLNSPNLCGHELLELHGIWLGAGSYVPIYANLDLVAYLASLAKDATPPRRAPVVLPVYSPNAIHFRRNHVVFVSTGLLLGIEDEQSLLSVISADLRKAVLGRPVDASEAAAACMDSGNSSRIPLMEIQAAIRRQIRGYESAAGQQLRRRPSDATHDSADPHR